MCKYVGYMIFPEWYWNPHIIFFRKKKNHFYHCVQYLEMDDHNVFMDVEDINDSVANNDTIDNITTSDNNMTTHDLQIQQWKYWKATVCPYMKIETDLFSEQVRGYTFVPNVMLRIKDYDIQQGVHDTIFIFHIFPPQEEMICKHDDNIIDNPIIEEQEGYGDDPKDKRRKGRYVKKEKYESLNTSAFKKIENTYLSRGYTLIRSIPVPMAYKPTENEKEDGVLIILDKVGVQKKVPLDDVDNQHRLLIVLVRSRLSDFSFTYDPFIYEHSTEERRDIIDSLNNSGLHTEFVFDELARILTSPFTVKKNTSLLSENIKMKRNEYLTENPQKGRRRVVFN